MQALVEEVDSGVQPSGGICRDPSEEGAHAETQEKR